MNMLTDTTRTTTPARTASHSRSISTVGTPGQSRKSTPSIRSKRPVKPSASKKERTVKRPKTPLGRDGKKLEEIDETESREGDEDNESESESEGSQVETTLVVCNAHSKVAAAYIDLVTDKLYIMEDVTDSSHFDTIDLVLHQIHPQMILVNSGAEDVLVEQLKAYAIAQNVKFEIQPQKDFQYIKSKNKLISLSLPSSIMRATSQNRSLSPENVFPENPESYTFSHGGDQVDDDMEYDHRSKRMELVLAGMLDFGKTLSISACGALLTWMAKKRAIGDLPREDNGSISVSGIETVTPVEFMQISADTLSSLGIFEHESHAYTHSSATKEGLSLYAILNTTYTPLGQKLLQSWLLRPLLSLKDIKARHDAVGVFHHPENTVGVDGIKGLLKGMGNVLAILKRMRQGITKWKDWKLLLEFCFKAVQLREGCLALVGSHSKNILKLVKESLDTELFSSIGSRLNEVIDWDETINIGGDRVCCKGGLDAELDDWKHQYAGLDSFLMQVAKTLGQDLDRQIVKNFHVTYFPQLGFQVAVNLVRPWDPDGEESKVLADWEYQFFTDERYYFKTPQMRDLDSHFGDIDSKIADREVEILFDLAEFVLESSSLIEKAVQCCSELDCCIAFASAATTFELKRPTMTEENILEIKDGRHPLQELVEDNFVPNSTLLCGGRGFDWQTKPLNDIDSDEDILKSVMILTGPNASGKSIYAKSVALITYMAHIGCFVPCREATIGLCDKIFTRLSTKESVSKLQSSFMIDLSQISYALRNSTARSLIIADEFGKGTVSTDGAGLLAGVIMHLLNRGQACPKTIITTHFHELFTNKLLPANLPVLFASMDVIVQDDIDDRRTHKPITYLYRLTPTLCLKSYAADCAQSQGIPLKVIERTRQVEAYISRFEYLPLQTLMFEPQEKADLVAAEGCCRAFLELDIDQAVESGVDLRERLKEILATDESNHLSEDAADGTSGN